MQSRRAEAITDYICGITGHYCVRGNVFAHYRPGSHDGPVTYCYSVENYGPVADPNIAANPRLLPVLSAPVDY